MKLEAKSRLLAATDILFHITSLYNATQILEQNRFALKPADTSQAEESTGGKAYYLSTARSPQSRYFSSYPSQCVFELSGQELNTKYKIRPVDYWRTGPDGKELEDRVLSRTPIIEGAAKYIRAVHLLVPNDDEYRRRVFQIYKACKRLRIPVYFGRGKYLNSLRPSQRVILTLQELSPPPAPERDEEGAAYDRRRAAPTHDDRLARSFLLPWQLLMRLEPGQEKGLTGEVRKRFDQRLHSLLVYSDNQSSFDCDMHNAKSARYGDPLGGRERMDWIVKFMREHHLDSRQLMEFLRDKWKSAN